MAKIETVSLKLVVVGETGVGKSALIERFARDRFDADKFESTIGAAFFAKTVQSDDKKSWTRLEIWDTAGQERYAALVPMYLRNCTGAVIVFDVTSEHTFERAKHWFRTLRARDDLQDVAMLLVGNKIDLKDERKVHADVALAFAESNGLTGYFDVSARSGEGVQQAFAAITAAMREVRAGRIKSAPNTIKLGKDNCDRQSSKSTYDSLMQLIDLRDAASPANSCTGSSLCSGARSSVSGDPNKYHQL